MDGTNVTVTAMVDGQARRFSAARRTRAVDVALRGPSPRYKSQHKVTEVVADSLAECPDTSGQWRGARRARRKSPMEEGEASTGSL